MERNRVLFTGLAISGGADSVYLYRQHEKGGDTDSGIPQEKRGWVLLHMNHGARGKESDEDQRFVERLAHRDGVPLLLGKMAGLRKKSKGDSAGFEARARRSRYAFFRKARATAGISSILVAHTADDQVETVLMRILEGAGISGLKGIPRSTDDGIERPLLDTWREEILEYLRRHKIPYRTDKSNFDIRFERNWIRHVLIPMLEKRYGKAVKKRIFTLGERFREIDDFLGATARRWMKRNVKGGPGTPGVTVRVPRAAYAKLQPVVRKKVVQILCFEALKVSPNERLIDAMDRLIASGKPSGSLSVGKGASLSCRYGDAVFRSPAAEDAPSPHQAVIGKLVVREIKGKLTPARLKALAAGERQAAFDAEAVSGPLSVRPLRAGDRIQPFGAPGKKKVKEILIDRKVPREERWGRPVVCDAGGEIVWIPGVVRSDAAPVGRRTRRVIVLTAGLAAGDSSE